MHHIIPWLHDLFMHYGVLGIVLPAFAQELFFPIPATLIMLSAGFFLFWGKAITVMSLWNLFVYAALPLSAGMTLGALVNYAVFYFVGKPIITYYGKYIRISWDHIQEVEDRLQKGTSDEVAFFLMRTLPIMPSAVISAFMGVIRWRFWAYTIITFLGGLISSYAFAFVGWQVGKFYISFAREIGKIELYAFAAIVIGLIGWLVYRRMVKEKAE